jgi:arylsulfate sulfotransferase
MSINALGYRFALLAALCTPAFAAVQITSMAPTLRPPQVLGTSITWWVKATDSSSGPLTFQFNVAPPGGTFALVKDFNVGTFSSGTWTSQPFVWVPTGIEGPYQIQVVVKDFNTGQSASQTATFQVNPLVTGSTPVVASTANPLVALFSAPSCAAGSTMRVKFQQQSNQTPPTLTNYMPCQPPHTMTFEIAGMYPSTTYTMFAETNTGGVITNGPTVTFKTGALPSTIPFPTFTVSIPAGPSTDTSDSLLLLDPVSFTGAPNYADVATDLSGNILWYYYASPPQGIVMTRPLSNGTILTIQTGTSWTPGVSDRQTLRQIDLAGNIIRETNTGIISQQLLALGATDGGPCSAVAKPAPVGAGCLDTFNHDAIQTLPNGYTAVNLDIEKIFPAGTQGDTSGLPVDIVGNMIIVLDTNWQIVWYFDAFQHDGGAPQLDINRPAVLGETVVANGFPVFLLGPGIAPQGKDWLHGNSIYYWPSSGDLIWSVRHQDWVVKIDYNNGAGTGNILWRIGPCGDFTFNNIYNDNWPWFSHQHEVDIEDGGSGALTLFDNGNTRHSLPGASSGCVQGLGHGNSRGMALNFSESSMQATPVISADLDQYSTGDGSAQLLGDGDYFFLAGYVLTSTTSEDSYAIELLPKAGTDTGTQVLNIEGPGSYRAWVMPNLYNPPIT